MKTKLPFRLIVFTLLMLSLNMVRAGSTVSPPPPVPKFASSDTAFCTESGECIDFFDLSTGTPTAWQWRFPGAQPDTSTSQNPTSICYYMPGTYDVTLIVTNASGTDSITYSNFIVFGSGAAMPVITKS